MSAFSLAVVSAVVWGVSAFFEKWGLRGADPMAGVFTRALGVFLGALVLAVSSPSITHRFMTMDGRSRWALMFGGLLASVVAQIFFYRALKIGDVGQVAVVGGSWPVVAFLLSAIFLGEPVTGQKLFGVALVISGAAMLR